MLLATAPVNQTENGVAAGVSRQLQLPLIAAAVVAVEATIFGDVAGGCEASNTGVDKIIHKGRIQQHEERTIAECFGHDQPILAFFQA